jgi:hypothetical protein
LKKFLVLAFDSLVSYIIIYQIASQVLFFGINYSRIIKIIIKLQFFLVADGKSVNESLLIDSDVIGKPLSDANDTLTLDDDIFRDAFNATDGGRKDPIEGNLFEGDISGVHLVTRLAKRTILKLILISKKLMNLTQYKLLQN